MSDRNQDTISKVLIGVKTPGEAYFRQLIWRKVKIRKSLDEICHYMELTLPESERGKVRKHDMLEVRVFNQYISESEKNDRKRRITTIMVDEVTSTADASQKSLIVMGRSPARDIIDSAWYGWEPNQKKLEEIANSIVSPFFDAIGIEKFQFQGRPHVTRMPWNGTETGPVFSFSWDAESPWTKLINEADNQGYIFTSNEAGNLYLWRVAPNVRDEGFLLKEGQNIRDIRYTQNGAEQFHEYVIRAAHKEASEIDPSCRNNRKKIINLTDINISQETLERRARTEMRRRRENKTQVTVTGWGLSDQQIKTLGDTNQREIFWCPNFLIPVKIPSLGLNSNLLISQVEHEASPSVMETAITLVNKDAYS